MQEKHCKSYPHERHQAKKEKRNGDFVINSTIIQRGHRSELQLIKMCHAYEQQEKRNNGRPRKAKSRKCQNAWRNGKLHVPGNIEIGHYQISGDKRKKEEEKQETFLKPNSVAKSYSKL